MRKASKRNRHNLINQTDAAAIIGVSRPTIPAMVAREELDGEKVAGLLFIDRESAERAAARRKAQKTADSTAA